MFRHDKKVHRPFPSGRTATDLAYVHVPNCYNRIYSRYSSIT